jgi:hypothetical protein
MAAKHVIFIAVNFPTHVPTHKAARHQSQFMGGGGRRP